MPQKGSILLKNGLIVTMNVTGEVLRGDILVENNKISRIGEINAPNATQIDCSHLILIPGLIQTHIHLCHTLFRGQADDLPLMPWLEQRMWPFEAGHNEESMRLSAQLGLGELLLSGTTTIQDMGSTNHYQIIFEEMKQSGIRAFGGKCMMDFEPNTPPFLLEKTKDSLKETEELIQAWHMQENSRLRYAVSPRYALSCTAEILRDSADLARQHGCQLHTHAAESRDEVSIVEKREKLSNTHFLHKYGYTGKDVTLAHCIWLGGKEKQLLVDTDTAITHCPSSNLKLASGVAPIIDYIQREIRLSLGSDSAASNNNLDMFTEMRLASLIHNPRYGADAISAKKVFCMATVDAAKTLNLDHEIGSLEEGKKADIVGVLDGTLHTHPRRDIYGQLVYATNSHDVQLTMVDGAVLMQNRELKTIDDEKIVAAIGPALKGVYERARAYV